MLSDVPLSLALSSRSSTLKILVSFFELDALCFGTLGTKMILYNVCSFNVLRLDLMMGLSTYLVSRVSNGLSFQV